MFFSLITLLFLLMLAWAMLYAYRTAGDPLHPLMFLAPLFGYAFVYRPWMLHRQGVLDQLFDERQLLRVETLVALGLLGFCLGALRHASQARRILMNARTGRNRFDDLLTPAGRGRAVEVAWLLGGLAVATYWIMIGNAGGLLVVYSQAKGGVSASSGYLGEMPLLSLSAIGLLYFAWTGQRFTLGRAMTLLLFASPLIVHGLLGARRGPTFMVVAALLVGGYAVSHRRPKLFTVFVGTFLLGVLALFLVNNRQRIFLGEAALQAWEDDEHVVVDANHTGDDWVFSSGLILASRDSETHYWGTRLLTNLLVRPIPRQFWPGKYADLGFEWIESQEEMGGMADNQWAAAVGWVPPRGAAAGFVADLFLEFSYFGLAFCYGFGWLYSYLWKRSVIDGGEWSFLYLFAAILSVYVPTQSVSAWIYRFVFLSVPTVVLWRMLVKPVLNVTRAFQPAPAR